MPEAKNKYRCRHSKAYPTVVANLAGYMWCPDCGSVRGIVSVKSNEFAFAEKGWRYPQYTERGDSE